VAGTLSEVNAMIERTQLGKEGHGIPTFNLQLRWGASCQAFGGYDLRWWGYRILQRILDIAGVDRWEDLPGKCIRIRQEHTKIHAIGHLLEDRWFCPEEEAPTWEH